MRIGVFSAGSVRGGHPGPPEFFLKAPSATGAPIPTPISGNLQWRDARLVRREIGENATPRGKEFDMSAKLLTTSILAGLGTMGALGLSLGRAGTKGAGDPDLLQALARAERSLADGIQQVSRSPEVAISAKFEMGEEQGEDPAKEKDEKEKEGGELSLSVYTAEKGLAVDAERNVLKEYAGSPEGPQWKPEAEVFKDAEHIARASEQLTLMGLSPLSLLDVVRKAEKDQPGTVYSVTPVLRDRKPMFEVLVAASGKSVTLWYDLLKGDAVRPAR